MNNSVFDNLFSPWRHPRNWLENIKSFFRSLKWCYQRAIKGYCDKDIWGLDSSICDYLYGTLKQLSKNCHGWPDSKFETYEEWQEYLSETAELFYRANLANEYYKNEYEEEYLASFSINVEKLAYKRDKELADKYLNREKEIFKQQQEDLKLGLKKLNDVFYALYQ